MADEYKANILLLGRNRSKKFYDANKDAINLKRREIYQHGKTASTESVESVKPKPTFTTAGKPTLDFSKTKTLSIADAIQYLTQVVPDAGGSLEKYKQDVKRLGKMTDNDDVIAILKNKKTIDIIKNAKQANGKPYANNTIKGVLQVCLVLIERFQLKIDKSKYLNEFKISKIQSADDNVSKAEEEPIYSFTAYLKMVKDKFGIGSKMDVLSELYNVLPVRDDFQLKIVHSLKETENKAFNYIVFDRTKVARIVIHNYKTSKLNGTIDEKMTAKMTKMLLGFATTNGLVAGDFLFGDKPLTGFVSSANKKMGVAGGVSEYRHMKISEELSSVKSPAERLKLSELMKHSPVTQLKYVRKHIRVAST